VLAAAAGVALSGAASARDYKIGCANGACAIVDDTGRISFFTVGNKTLAEGADQLKIPATDRIRPPLNISCCSAAGGDACVVTDADGGRFRRAGYENPGSRSAVTRSTRRREIGSPSRGRLGAFCRRRAGTAALRQAMKTIENIVRLTDCAADLALEAVPICRRSGGKPVELALTSR
jgi:hypothetical protein